MNCWTYCWNAARVSSRSADRSASAWTEGSTGRTSRSWRCLERRRGDTDVAAPVLPKHLGRVRLQPGGVPVGALPPGLQFGPFLRVGDLTDCHHHGGWFVSHDLRSSFSHRLLIREALRGLDSL